MPKKQPNKDTIFRIDKDTDKMLNKLAEKYDRDRSWIVRFLIKQEYEKANQK